MTRISSYSDKLTDSHKRLEMYVARMQEIQEKENQKISHELYDNIGQSLLLAKIKLQKYAEVFSKNGESWNFNELLSLLEMSCNEIKSISQSLRPRILDEMGIGMALSSMVNSISKRTGIRWSVDIIEENGYIDSGLQAQLYGIVRDIINNRVRNSHVSEFSIQLINQPEKIQLFLSDDGTEETPGWHNSDNEKIDETLPIDFIGQKVKNLNGIMKIDFTPFNGNLIIVEIPKKIS
ncbi:MAG: hypothetical protein WCJ01_06760 [Ignavibacteria bacterium]